MAEWFKAPVLKTGCSQGRAGSNPVLSDLKKGDYEAARTLLKESQALKRDLGDHTIAFTLEGLAKLGLGGALTHALVREIRNRGYKDTWIWASNIAKSVYQKLGYVEADFGLREHSWFKR